MTDDDRNLLERAARAEGYVPVRLTDDGAALLLEGVQKPWNSLHENPHSDCMGDALRLAVKLHMTLRCYMGNTCAQIGVPGGKSVYINETNQFDHGMATRRAITRAAAEMAP